MTFVATATKSHAGRVRAPWGTISRDQIVEAAMRAIRGPGGFEEMTIRGLAADLGVAPMSLYRHVRDKTDLLDEVVDLLLTRVWKPRADESDWKAWIAEAAEKLRKFLVSQPAALHVYLSHPVVSPSAIRRMEAVMEVLRGALGDERSAQRAYAAIHTYTIGFAALEASREGWDPTEAGPAHHDLADRLAAYTTARQFAEGLNYLLNGIAQQAGVR